MQVNARRKLKRLLHEIHELAAENDLSIDEELAAIASAAAPTHSDEDPRNVVRKLGSFTITELADALGRSRPTAEKIVRELRARNIVRETGLRRKHEGPGRPAPVFEYVTIDAKPVNREKRTPIEVEAAQQMHAPPKRNRAVRGTGKRRRATNPEVRELIRIAEANGCRVQPTGSQHFNVYAPSGKIINLPSTPSDHRSILNVRSQMRQAGIPVP